MGLKTGGRWMQVVMNTGFTVAIITMYQKSTICSFFLPSCRKFFRTLYKLLRAAIQKNTFTYSCLRCLLILSHHYNKYIPG